MYKKLTAIGFTAALLHGCASVPMESAEANEYVKNFAKPFEGNAGLYVYRPSILGTAIKKDIWVDDKCLGESAYKVFFYMQVKGDEEHKLSTESEFSENDLYLKTEAGKNYFVKQSMKMGLFVAGAKLVVVDEEKAKKEILKLPLATRGNCSKPRP